MDWTRKVNPVNRPVANVAKRAWPQLRGHWLDDMRAFICRVQNHSQNGRFRHSVNRHSAA